MNQLEETVTRKVDTLLESLFFISKYYQRATSKESLVNGLSIFGEVMDVKNFVIASKKVDLISKLVSREKIENISVYTLPAVILTKEYESMVLLDYNIEKNVASVIIPELNLGETTIPLDELNNLYTGKVIIIKPAYNFENRVAKEVSITEPKKWFWGTMKKNKEFYVRIVVASIFINIFVLALPLFIMNVYDRVLPNNAIESLWALTIGVFIVFIFDFVLKTIRSYYIGKASKRADIIMSNKIFDHLLNLRVNSKPASTGMFVNRLQSFEAIKEFFTTATITTLVDIPFLFIFVAIMFYIGGPLGWVPVITIIITIGFSFFIQKIIKKSVLKAVKEDQLKQTTLNETVTGLEIIKSVRGQNRMKTHWDKSLGQTAYFGEKSQLLSQAASNFTELIIKSSNIVVVVLGVFLAVNGDMTMGGIVASMMLNRRAVAPASKIVDMVIKYDKTVIALKNIDDIMNLEVEKDHKVYLSRPHLNGNIEFQDVSFSYKNQNYEVLKNVNLKINEGEKVAILGKIGSGKSTLIKMIQNLYVPTKGSVLIDNTDVRQIDPVDLRKAIGVVPQESFLFMGSVKDNITIGDPFATDEEVLAASKIAGVHDFLGKHEAGYDFIVGERGEGLSGGERQSITLARALVGNPSFLIFDEPTNSMDKQTEKEFIRKLKDILVDQTVIIVTHKLSLLSLVDRVIVLDNGKIIADGPKEKVFANSKKSEDEKR
jgi:ATP-binding cassette subfamily C protein LapB